MAGWMVLCVVIRFVGGPRLPVDLELLLLAAVSNPVVSHVYGLGLPLTNCVIGKTLGTCVVCDEWCCRLWMSHFNECVTNGCSFLSIVESTSNFYYSCTGNDGLQDLCCYMDMSIVGGGLERADK